MAARYARMRRGACRSLVLVSCLTFGFYRRKAIFKVSPSAGARDAYLLSEQPLRPRRSCSKAAKNGTGAKLQSERTRRQNFAGSLR